MQDSQAFEMSKTDCLNAQVDQRLTLNLQVCATSSSLLKTTMPLLNHTNPTMLPRTTPTHHINLTSKPCTITTIQPWPFNHTA